MRVDFQAHSLFVRLFAERLGQAHVGGQAAGDTDRTFDVDGAQQLHVAAGHGEMNAFENVGGGDAAADHVDDVGFRQHGADAADQLGIGSAAGKRPNLFQGHPQVAGYVFQELAGAGGALASHTIGQHAAALVNAQGAGVEGADVQDGADRRHQEGGATCVRRHTVEVAAAELHQLALAGAGHIGDVVG